MAKKTVKHSKRSSTKSGGTTKVDQLFKNGEPSRGFSNLPTGTYEGYVKPGSALIEPKGQGSSDYRAVIDLVVSDSDEKYGGRTQRARYDLSTEIGVNIFMGDLEAMDLGKPSSLSEAAEMLSESDNIPVSFWVSEPQDEFPPKVRINERLEGEGGAAVEDEDDEPTEDEYTEDEIRSMDEDELTELANDNDVNPDDYEWDELYDKMVELLV